MYPKKRGGLVAWDNVCIRIRGGATGKHVNMSTLGGWMNLTLINNVYTNLLNI